MLPIRPHPQFAVGAITDSLQIARAGAEAARRGAMIFQKAPNATLGAELARSGTLALLIVDLRAPGVEPRLVGRIRNDGFAEPVVCVGAEHDSPPVAGADDLIPAHVREPILSGRIAAKLRSRSGVFARGFSIGELTLQPAVRRVTVAGQTLELTPSEYALLLLLVTRAGCVVSKDEIQLVVLASRSAAQNAYFHIHNLKAKLGAAGALIRNVRGAGYVLR